MATSVARPLASSWRLFVRASGGTTKARVLAAGRPIVPRPLAVRVRQEIVEESGPSES